MRSTRPDARRRSSPGRPGRRSRAGSPSTTSATTTRPGTLTCPNQVTRPLSKKRTVTFGAACRGCPLRDRCTTSSRGRKITVHRHERLQRRHRQRAQDLDFQQTYREKRPLVERTIAWLVNGNRRVPYRGVAKNNAWLQHRVAALNLRRLLALGLNLNNGTWQLA